MGFCIALEMRCGGNPRGGGAILIQEECVAGREKRIGSFSVTVPQTDTGGQRRSREADERTLVKELGKFAP